jgi:hypothetical protein
MDRHAYSYDAAKPFSNDFDAQDRTGLELVQVRRNRTADTFKVLYDGRDNQRYPVNAIAQLAESSAAAVVTKQRPDPVKAALSRHLEEIFGLDLTVSDEPRFSQESVHAAGLYETSTQKTRTKKRASLFRKLKSLAKAFRRQDPVGYYCCGISRYSSV